MTQYLKFSVVFSMLIMVMSCKKKQYSMGDLTAPSDVTITAVPVGQDASHPNGDGSGNVQITLSGKNVLAYDIDYGTGSTADPKYIPGSTVTHKYTKVGLNTYTITVVAYGPGATSTKVTKDIQVQSDFTVDPNLVKSLTNNSSKSWSVDKSVAGHLGVGPWGAGNVTPAWWSAGVNEKVQCCNCFYTATYTFTEVSANSYKLTVNTPDGAFTKTGALAGGLPGIPAAGDEGCYSYGGGSSSFTFAPASSGVAASAPSTQTSIVLDGKSTFIGYGATLKEYEILSITDNTMYLRVQGTETGNAWYIKLKANQ